METIVLSSPQICEAYISIIRELTTMCNYCNIKNAMLCLSIEHHTSSTRPDYTGGMLIAQCVRESFRKKPVLEPGQIFTSRSLNAPK